MRNHTKLTAAAAIVGATALLAGACGTTEDVVVEPAAPVVTEPATAPEAPATEPAATPEAPATGDCAAVTGTVDFRWWGGDARAALQLEAIDAFNALYPNITINPMPVAFDGYWAQLQVEAVAGNTPDVFTANEAWLAALFGAGVLADLSAEPNLDLSQYTTDMLGAAVAPNGHVYAIPTGGNARAVVVNYDILEQAGIDVPDDETWSWDDFLAIAQQVSDAGLTNAAGETIFGASDIGSQGTARVWANQTDGGMFDAAGNLTWTEPSMTDFLQLVTDLESTGAAAPATLQTELNAAGPGETLMAQNRAAFQFSWSNQLPAIAAATDGANLGLLRTPGDNTSAHVGTWLNPTMFFAQSANAQDPEAAACFLNFMANNTDAAEIMSIDRGVPFNPVMLQAVEPNLSGDNLLVAQFMTKIADNAAASIPMPELTEDLNLIVLQATDPVMFQLMTPAQGGTLLMGLMQDAMVGN